MAKAAQKSVSVTQVRVAFECPRLFYLAARFGGRTLFGSGAGVGIAFHQLADACAHELRLTRLPKTALLLTEPSQLAQQLQQHLYRRVFFPYLQKVASTPAQVATVQPLWQAMQRLVQQWAELILSNRRFCQPEEVIAKTLLAEELKVQHEFTLPDGERQLVQGRFDSLLYDFALHRLCVVEYKTYIAPDPSAQLVQVALYGYLLHQQLGVPIDSAVYSVLPDWQGTVYAWEQLAESLHQLLPAKLQQMRAWLGWESPQPEPPPMTAYPQLCDICPQRQTCQSFFDLDADSGFEPGFEPELPQADGLPAAPGAIADSPRSSQAPSQAPSQTSSQVPSQAPSRQPAARLPKPSAPVESLAQQLIETLDSFGLTTDYQGAAVGPAFVRMKLKPALGVRVSSIMRLADDLRVQLGLSQSPLIAPQTGYVSVDLPRPDRQTAAFADYIEVSRHAEAIPNIAIGVDLNDQLIEADLSDPNTCHFLVGGTTGSGKSEFLRSQLLSLLTRHAPDRLKIALVDPKRVTFPEFEQSPYLIEPIVKDSDGAVALMTRLVADMEDRYQRFERSRCSDIAQYNRQTHQPLPRIVCIFDEYADFMADKTIRQTLEYGIKRLGAMARAAGIHLIIATQRPDASVVTPLIRANLPGRVALRTASEADSAIILGGKQTAAVQLLGKGDLLFLNAGQIQRLQSLFATATIISSRLR
ncbi:MAG: DNA translocase FtsK [Cyanobacteria bacterium P01_A01_bin.114]